MRKFLAIFIVVFSVSGALAQDQLGGESRYWVSPSSFNIPAHKVHASTAFTLIPFSPIPLMAPSLSYGATDNISLQVAGIFTPLVGGLYMFGIKSGFSVNEAIGVHGGWHSYFYKPPNFFSSGSNPWMQPIQFPFVGATIGNPQTHASVNYFLLMDGVQFEHQGFTLSGAHRISPRFSLVTDLGLLVHRNQFKGALGAGLLRTHFESGYLDFGLVVIAPTISYHWQF